MVQNKAAVSCIAVTYLLFSMSLYIEFEFNDHLIIRIFL
jgi:hypothetical protein